MERTPGGAPWKPEASSSTGTRRPRSARRDLRAHLHGMWAAVAGAWGEHADVRRRTRRGRHASGCSSCAAPRPGERVLELACGPGGVGLAAAALVAPGGEVVALRRRRRDDRDRGGARRGARARATCARACSTSSEIDEPDGAYDVVLCREGLMFAPDPARAAREIRRVLRPGGRVALAVWGPRERNPWLALVFDAGQRPDRRARAPAGRARPVLAGELRAVASRCSSRPGWPRCGRRGADAAAGGLLRGVVGADVGARRDQLARILAGLPADAAQALRERLRERQSVRIRRRQGRDPRPDAIASARR